MNVSKGHLTPRRVSVKLLVNHVGVVLMSETADGMLVAQWRSKKSPTEGIVCRHRQVVLSIG